MGKREQILPVLTVTGQRIEGVVRWFKNKEGYGFIRVEGFQDVFVHMAQVHAADLTGLREEDTISFVLQRDKRNPKRTLATDLHMVQTKTETKAKATKVPKGKSGGVVVRIFHRHEYGFIRPNVGGDDLFFGRGTVVGLCFEQLRVRQDVSYRVRRGKDGRPQAFDVELL